MHQAPSLSTRATGTSNSFVSGTGPLFIAYLLNWGLYGVLSVQTYLYHLAFPTDNRVHKWLVYSVYFLETVDIIFLTYDALADFRNVFGLSVFVSSADASFPVQFSWLRVYIFGGIVTCMVQFYHAYNLNYLRRSKTITGAILLAGLTQCFAGLVAGSRQAKYNFYATATQTKIPTEIHVFGYASAVCSINISVVRMHQLMWGNTERKVLHPCISTLVRLFVETGVLAALAAVTYVVLFFCHISALNLMVPALLLSKIYSNSLLLALNGRMNVALGRVRPAVGASSFFSPGSAMAGSRAVFAVQVTKQVEVQRSIA